MSATDFLAQLQRAVEAEQAPARQLTDEQKSLIGTWHYVGSGGATLPATGEGIGATGTTVGYGAEVQMSEALLLNSFDRVGDSPLVRVLSDEDEQIAVFGEIRWRRGAWPRGALKVRPGSHESIAEATVKREAAWRLENVDERAAALSRLKDEYGADYFGGSGRSRSVGSYDGGDGRDALMTP